MPYAKYVSAKTQYFDKEGNCIETDYIRMIKIVKDPGLQATWELNLGDPVVKKKELRKQNYY